MMYLCVPGRGPSAQIILDARPVSDGREHGHLANPTKEQSGFKAPRWSTPPELTCRDAAHRSNPFPLPNRHSSEDEQVTADRTAPPPSPIGSVVPFSGRRPGFRFLSTACLEIFQPAYSHTEGNGPCIVAGLLRSTVAQSSPCSTPSVMYVLQRGSALSSSPFSSQRGLRERTRYSRA